MTHTSTEQHLFSNRDLRKLLLPLILEQLLSTLMGTVDTIMVTNVGSAAISAVSLVDSINILVIQAFAALAAGGAIVCSHYVGSGEKKEAGRAAGQVLFITMAISLAVTVVCVGFRKPMLRLIFGSVEEEVMANALAYFLFTGLSFPFIALYNSGAAIFRAQENTRLPMGMSILSNILNIIGNAILIWGFGLGAAGAAISTLTSRIFCAVAVMWCLHRPNQEIRVHSYLKIRPDGKMIKRILGIGIPSGIENSMFQFGKLAIQSTVSTLGTTAIAAQAMASIMEAVNGVGGMGIGIGLMTVVGECLGAGRKDEAVYYTKKLTHLGYIGIGAACIAVWILIRPLTIISGMEPESAALCISMVTAITVVKPFLWPWSFIPAYGLRAAGDAKFTMTISCITMWLCRVSLSVLLMRQFHMGPMAVWIGMFSDWFIRSIIFHTRFSGRKWLRHNVIGE